MILTLENLADYCTEEGNCLLWNLGTNGQGYPIARLDGRGQGVRRYVFSHLMGNKIGKRRVSARCSNLLCVAPGCMWPRTAAEMISASYRDGGRNPATEAARGRAGLKARGWQILDIARAREIRARRSERAESLAVEYKVCQDTIRKIWRGSIWPESSPFDQLLRLAA